LARCFISKKKTWLKANTHNQHVYNFNRKKTKYWTLKSGEREREKEFGLQ